MASPDRLRLYGDSYPGIPPRLLRDLNRMFETRDKEIDELKATVEDLQSQVTVLKDRIDDAGIP